VFFSWFHHLSVMLCCSSSCAAWCCSSSCAMLFDFLYCCGVRLIHIVRSTSVNYRFSQWFGHQRCKSERMDIPVTLVFSEIEYHLRLIHFAGLSFTFLAKLNIWLYLMYYINLNKWISFYFCKNKKHGSLRHKVA
jgi:hypothetical protein